MATGDTVETGGSTEDNNSATTAKYTKSDTKVVPSSGPVTDITRKHPLENSWTLWFFKNDRSKKWEDNLRQVVTFGTVEDFWAVYNHIEMPSNLPVGCDYNLFKDGIRPMWEDERNNVGGRWLINLPKSQRARDLDPCWLELLMCLIGEAFGDYSEEICGCVVNVRGRGDKLSVWTAQARNEEATMSIGRKVRERLNIPKDMPVVYERHDDSATKSGSTAKAMYQV